MQEVHRTRSSTRSYSLGIAAAGLNSPCVRAQRTTDLHPLDSPTPHTVSCSLLFPGDFLTAANLLLSSQMIHLRMVRTVSRRDSS